MPFAQHTAPIYPGENPLEHPGFDDPRLKPWLKELVKLGVMDKEGTALKEATLRKGIGPKGYMWRLDWKENK